jgi:hypothetical protein
LRTFHTASPRRWVHRESGLSSSEHRSLPHLLTRGRHLVSSNRSWLRRSHVTKITTKATTPKPIIKGNALAMARAGKMAPSVTLKASMEEWRWEPEARPLRPGWRRGLARPHQPSSPPGRLSVPRLCPPPGGQATFAQGPQSASSRSSRTISAESEKRRPAARNRPRVSQARLLGSLSAERVTYLPVVALRYRVPFFDAPLSTVPSFTALSVLRFLSATAGDQ